jgi:hypothetical protein
VLPQLLPSGWGFIGEEVTMSKFRTGLILLVTLIPVLQTSAREPLPPPPVCTASCPFLAEPSSLDSRNVSKAYAESILCEVKSVFCQNLIPPQDSLLDLFCSIERNGDSVTLEVNIRKSSANESYIAFSSTTCFFTPSELIRPLASSFGTAYRSDQKDEYSASDSPRGIVLGPVSYPESRFDDLFYDLRKTKDLPKSVSSGIDSYKAMMSLDNLVAFVAGLAIVWGTGKLVAAFTIPAGRDRNQLLVESGATLGACCGVVAFFRLLNADNVRRIQGKLQEWNPQECR